VFSLAVADDGGAPEGLVFGEPDAFVSGAGVSFVCVPGVLGDGGQAEVGPAVVQAGAVHVVDDVSFRRPDELAVHEDARVFPVGQAHGAFGVEHVLAFRPAEAPLVLAQARVVGGIDDGELALRERDFPEGVPEAQTAPDKHQPYSRLFQPRWDSNTEIDDSRRHGLSGLEIRLSGDQEIRSQGIRNRLRPQIVNHQ